MKTLHAIVQRPNLAHHQLAALGRALDLKRRVRVRTSVARGYVTVEEYLTREMLPFHWQRPGWHPIRSDYRATRPTLDARAKRAMEHLNEIEFITANK